MNNWRPPRPETTRKRVWTKMSAEDYLSIERATDLNNSRVMPRGPAEGVGVKMKEIAPSKSSDTLPPRRAVFTQGW